MGSQVGRGKNKRVISGVKVDRLVEGRKAAHGSASLQEAVAAPSQEAFRTFIEAGICPFCGKGPFKMIGVHCNKIHGVDKIELRDLAGMKMSEKLCLPEISAKMAAAYDIERGNAVRAAGQKGKPKRMTEAGRQARTNNLETWTKADPERHREQARKAARSVDPVKHREAIRRFNAENPGGNPVAIAAMHTPEAKAKRMAAIAANYVEPDHGVVARYKRGCRCELCRAAKREYRAKSKSDS